MQKFAPRFTERKSSNKRNKIFQLSCALKKLSNKMFFALIRSVLFKKRLHVNQTTTTSSAILTEENFSFAPYSVEICHKIQCSIEFGYNCRSVLKHVLKSYDNLFDIHNSHKRVVGLIYTKQFMSQACRKLVVCDKVVSCKSAFSVPTFLKILPYLGKMTFHAFSLLA